jgi:predicted GTPase
LDAFYDYLKNTFIGEGAIFSPTVWAEASSELTKSTNACESFHAHFKSNFNHSHPNIFMFIDTLKNIQSEIHMKLQSIHKPNSCNNCKLKRRKQLLNQLIENYKEQKITIFHYIKTVSYYYSIKK